eukprot:gnl/MRDRNA2_/MRDRNA2_211504_c0_seq1.p1 gnl/MRDRNA2_/MRDRNA2_211504_c0~~gnl/MRDRNA2_/MRDRNA2_211504_c0_seq1.p1  ORF type:complete len:122 (+),score=6.84 gnl/MRDRNA2_/MRDRNA2_211504_c0_seq1:454-819(+)
MQHHVIISKTRKLRKHTIYALLSCACGPKFKHAQLHAVTITSKVLGPETSGWLRRRNTLHKCIGRNAAAVRLAKHCTSNFADHNFDVHGLGNHAMLLDSTGAGTVNWSCEVGACVARPTNF